MKRILIKAVIFAVIGTAAIPVFAQNKNNNSKVESESVTIRKTGPTDQKMTIVIDGNNVTVNGIPVENFKSDNVEVTKGANGMSVRAPLIRNFSQGIETNKAFLGVMTEANDKGAMVKDVTENSPAAKAGLKNDDIITKVNGDKISDANDLYKTIGKYKPEDKVSITYLRDGKESQTEVTLGKNDQVRVWGFGNDGNNSFNFQAPDIRSFPDMRSFPFEGFRRSDQARLGLQVQDLQEGKGVKVIEVESGMPGEKTGIQKDDVITELNGKAIAGVDDIKDAMRSINPGDTVSVTYVRKGKTVTTKINFPKKLKTSDI